MRRRFVAPSAPCRTRRQRGAVLVESALVLITLLCMMIFIMDMGRLLMMQQFCVERARAAVRSAVVNNWDSAKTANFACYNSIAAPGGNTSTPGLLGLLPSQVTFQSLGTAGASDHRFQVTIQGVPMYTWIPYMAGKYTAAPAIATLPAQSLGATN
jgi:Flp pilus assembly protein TadG